jgi:NADPH-dependent 2,4-dienoyl-CoA reductase/sulfur reductase-like enzyme
MTNESGWIPVDRNRMGTSVYAVGDVITIPLSIGLPLSKADRFAAGQAEAVAETIAHEIAEERSSSILRWPRGGLRRGWRRQNRYGFGQLLCGASPGTKAAKAWAPLVLGGGIFREALAQEVDLAL